MHAPSSRSSEVPSRCGSSSMPSSSRTFVPLLRRCSASGRTCTASARAQHRITEMACTELIGSSGRVYRETSRLRRVILPLRANPSTDSMTTSDTRCGRSLDGVVRTSPVALFGPDQGSQTPTRDELLLSIEHLDHDLQLLLVGDARQRLITDRSDGPTSLG